MTGLNRLILSAIRFFGYILSTAAIWAFFILIALVIGKIQNLSRLLIALIPFCCFFYLWLHIMMSSAKELLWKLPLLLMSAIGILFICKFRLAALFLLAPIILMPLMLYLLSLFFIKRDPFLVWLLNNMREMYFILWGEASCSAVYWVDKSDDFLESIFVDKLIFLLLSNVLVLVCGLIYRHKLFKANPQAVCTLVKCDLLFDPPIFMKHGLFRVHAILELITDGELMKHRPNHSILPLPPTLFLLYPDAGNTFNCPAGLTIQMDGSYFNDLLCERAYHDFLSFISERKKTCSITVFIENRTDTPLFREMEASLKEMGIVLVYAQTENNGFADNDDFVLELALLQAQFYRRITALLLEMHSIIPDTDKYRFPKILLERLSENDVDPVDVFFHMIKLSEYIVHYRALCVLAHNPQKAKICGDSLLYPAFGTWNDIQRDYLLLSDPEAAIESMYYISSKTARGKVNKLIGNWFTACNILVNLRNRYVGHGTLTYSVSEELLYHLCRLVLLVLKEFTVQDESLASEDVFSPLTGQIVPCTLEDGIYLYSSADQADQHFNAEYLDYATGDYQKLTEDRYVWKLLR